MHCFFFSSCQIYQDSKVIQSNNLEDFLIIENQLVLNTYEAYLDTCQSLLSKNNIKKKHKNTCSKVFNNRKPKIKEAVKFFRNNFYINSDLKSNDKGLMTGYYEPEVLAYKYKKKDSYPIYKINAKRYGQALFENTRKKINEGILKNKKLEIAWIDNEIEAFFLHIQGSGRLKFPNGEIIKVKYAASNKKKYTAIGKILIENGHINRKDLSMFAIKNWLYKNKNKAKLIMEKNKRYIFFEEYTGEIKGSSRINLVPLISVAVDPSYHNIGDIFLITEYTTNKKFLAIAHDTGAAIKGKNRIDLFTGYGKEAEKLAAILKNKIIIKKLEPLHK